MTQIVIANAGQKFKYVPLSPIVLQWFYAQYVSKIDFTA